MKRKNNSPRRTVLVFSTLVGILSLTSVILLLLAPAPLLPGPAESLFAVDSPDSLAAIFDTRKQLAPWHYIYIHQSHSIAEPAGMLPDHFVIGNGNGPADGEVQLGQRWVDQLPAAPPAGAARIANDCISICLIGDLDQSVPTPTQLRRLIQLTESLQTRFHIPASHILFVDRADSSIGIGQYFPIAAFREKILH